MVCNQPAGPTKYPEYSNAEFAYNKVYNLVGQWMEKITPFERQQYGNATILVQLAPATVNKGGFAIYKEWIPIFRAMGFKLTDSGIVNVMIHYYTVDMVTPLPKCAWSPDLSLGKIWINDV